jgi:putative tryptophan/tyrosine transport system substrate-binding protein
MIRRREFIALLGGATAWPVAARAQQGERVRYVGVLIPYLANDLEGQDRVGAFQQEMQQLGWAIGRNVRIDTRWAGPNTNDVRIHAAELVALAPDVIQATGSASGCHSRSDHIRRTRPVWGNPVYGVIARGGGDRG